MKAKDSIPNVMKLAAKNTIHGKVSSGKTVTSFGKTEQFTDEQCQEYFAELQKQFDIACRDRMFSVDLSYYLSNSGFSTAIKRELGRGEGTIYPETMIAVVDLVDKILNRKNICVLGLIQSSKTAVQVLGAIIACAAMSLRDGKICVPIFVTPNGKSYVGQFESKLERIITCFGEAKIVYKSRSKPCVSINDCLRKTQTEIREEMEIHLENDEMISMKQRIRLQEDIKKFQFSFSNCTVLPVSRKFISLFNLLFSCVLRKDYSLLFMRDECHAAAGEDSVNDRMFKNDIVGYGKSFYEALIDKDHVQCVMTSATNWQTINLEPVPIPVNESYCGLDLCYEHEGSWHKIANGVNKLPVLKNLEEMSVIIGNRDLADIKPSVYKEEEKFSDNDQLRQKYKTHQRYKDAMGIALADLFNWIRANKPKPCNFTDKEFGNCIVFRFANDNDVMDDILEKIVPQLKGFVVVRAYGPSGQYGRVEDLVKHKKISDTEFCLFCATAKARMSDSFPAKFSYGVDLTFDSSTLAALKQGIYGRVCGFLKDPFLVMSVKNVQVIRDHIKNDYRPDKSTKKLHHDQKTIRARTALQFRFGELANYPQFCEIEAELNAMRYGSQVMRSNPGWYTSEFGRNDEHAAHVWKVVSKHWDFIEENLPNFFVNITSEVVLMKPGVTYMGKDDRPRCFVCNDKAQSIPALTTRSEQGSRGGGGKEEDKIVIRVRATKSKNKKPKIVGFDLPVVSKRDQMWVNNVGKNVADASKMKRLKDELR